MTKVPLWLTDTPGDDRYVSLTEHRLLASTVHVVAVVDATGRLADPSTLRATTSRPAAEHHADRLVSLWGGVADQPDIDRHLPRRTVTATAPPTEARPSSRTATPKLLRNGKWQVKVRHHGQRHRAVFDTQQEAQQFIDSVKGT